ncbi:prepilin-type N-terminal cleavage/methylation domain-containing protein [uncultured Sphaerotilus sp.]|uniref:pilus assembly FimT family protein n=1 Tax=uncultured Sphaerotilus sp. TaxID=474984 RepID=UPI0030CA3A97
MLNGNVRLPRRQGFTLIELLVTLTLVGVLLSIATPMMATWTANVRVRAVAEQLGNDLRLTQSEALRRNRQTVLALTNATPALNATAAANGNRWFAQALPMLAGETLTDRHFVLASSSARQNKVSISGPAVTCFNAIGRPVSSTATGLGQNCTAPTSATTPAQYVVSATSSNRPLRVSVFMGGQVRLCDPARSLAAGAADGC